MPMVFSPKDGICMTCRSFVRGGDVSRHPCPEFMLDTSWNALLNPVNEEWRIGYRFYTLQPSQRVGRLGRHKVHRTYKVRWEIDQNGDLQHTGGPKPTDDHRRAVAATYEREREKGNT